MIRLAINGYGRIGRIAHRIIIKDYLSEIDVVAINAGSSTDAQGWSFLLKYDSVYGQLDANVSAKKQSSLADAIGTLIVNGKEIPVFSGQEPSLLPWGKFNVDVVIESTGAFRTQDKLSDHFKAGAKKVVLSSPAKDSGQSIPTFVLSVNDNHYKGEKLISNASCTTNCIAPVAKVMLDNFGIEKAMMTTVHGYTSDQRLHDGGHKDYRRARAAALNIIPTTTGATKAAANTIPELANIFTGLALRVPVPTGSVSDITFLLAKNTTKEEINEVFKKAAQSDAYKGILSVTEDPIVSSDIIGNPHSAIVDLSLTSVVGGNMAKVIAWYDNEYGYAKRLVEEALMVCQSTSL